MNITIPGYKIEHLIAEGGTASIYLAIQESLQRHVAIKLLRKIDNPTQLNRFINEGQIIASLNHRNVINIHDVGVTEDGRPYISMEYLEGGDLDARTQKKVDPEDALRWLEAIGHCLDFVHRKGIIHRDIKPGNILFHKDGTLILSDFGTAKQEDSDARLTLEGLTFGSPYYISPEQATSKELDGRTDIYSLGIVLYEILTGNKPYKGDSHIETIAAHLSEPLPDLPPELQRYRTLIRKMIAKSPDDRFTSAAEMVRFVQQLRKPVNHARLMTSVSARAVSIARDMVGFLQQLRKSVKHSRLMTRVSTRAVAIAADMVRFARQWQIPVKHARPMTRVSTGAVAIILGIVGASVIGQLIISDRDEHRAAAGMTISEGAVTESSPAMTETPVQEPAPDHNKHQTPQVTTTSEAAIPESVPPVAEMPSAEVDNPVTETPAPPDNNEQQIEKLLSQAAEALEAYRLTTPENNNARDYYQQILGLNPQHEKALKGMERIADTYADLAESKLDKFAYEAAKQYVHRGLTIQPENPRLLGLKKKVNIGTILAQADTALKEYRLTTPKNGNAYFYYQRVLELHPRNEKALKGINRIADTYADLAESKLDEFDYKAAKQYVHRGLTVQPENTRLQSLQKNTNTLRDAPKRIWKKLLSPFSETS